MSQHNMAVVSIDLFDVLLMEISNNLSNDNLRSLKHVCRSYLNENQRETVKHGLELFEILRKRDVVTAERDKIENLLRIITAMRPKRKDLIRKVEHFIKQNHEFPEAFRVINFQDRNELEDSFSNKEGNAARDSEDSTERSKSGTFNPLSRSRCCSFDICCCACNCYTIRVPPCIYASLSVFIIFLAIFTVLAWYADVPCVHPFLTKNTELKRAGKYVIILLFVIAGVFLILYSICARRTKSQLEGFSSLQTDYGSISRSETVPYRQQSFNSLSGYGTSSVKDISEHQYKSMSTSGFSSRVSSRLSTPPYFMHSQVSVEQKQNVCAYGCNACNGLPAVPGIKDNYISGHGRMDEIASPMRQQSHGPNGMHKGKDEAGTSFSGQVCGERLDSDVEPDSGFQVPQHSIVKENKSLSPSSSSGIFFSVANDEDVGSYTEEKDKNYDWY